MTKMTKMTTIANFFVGLVILLQVCFLILEMFFWDKPLGLWAFDLKQDVATASRSLAANQGLYNGFLAAGLVWGLILGPAGTSIKVFFLSCVVVAGVFGGLMGEREMLLKIISAQAIPAAVALVLVLRS